MARVDFDAPNLAAQLDALSDAERDALPFGCILLDGEGIVRFYNKTEERIAKYPGEKVGRNFFEMAKRASKDELWNSIQRALDTHGKVDLDFGWAGDHADPNKQFRLRVQSARNGGVWLCFERDPEPSGSAA